MGHLYCGTFTRLLVILLVIQIRGLSIYARINTTAVVHTNQRKDVAKSINFRNYEQHRFQTNLSDRNSMHNNASCSFIGIEGCTVENNQAVCTTTDAVSTISLVPSCVTDLQIVISTMEVYRLYFDFMDFSHLYNLEMLSIKPLNSTVYYRTHAYCDSNTNVFQNQKRLQHLQINLIFRSSENLYSSLLEPLTSLKYLDITGAKNVQLDSFTIPSKCAIKHLHLRYSQSLDMSFLKYKPSVDISKLMCPVGATLELADLSYNSIVALIFQKEQMDCFHALQVLDLRENSLHTCAISVSLSPSLHCRMSDAINLFSVQHLLLGISNREYDINKIFNSQDQKQYEMMLKTHMPYVDLPKYAIEYAKYLANVCNTAINTLMTCIWNIGIFGDWQKTQVSSKVACRMKVCVLSNATSGDYSECETIEDDLNIIQSQLNEICKMDCFLGFPFPFVPTLQTLILKNYNLAEGGYIGKLIPDPLYNDGQLYKVCIYPNNHWRYVDVSQTITIKEMRIVLSKVIITGLQNIEILNLSQLDAAAFHPGLLSDMPYLKHLNMSHNTMSLDGHLNDTWFSMNEQLIDIDISYMGIEAVDKFVFRHLTNLSVLDLSHNSLEGGFDVALQNVTHLHLSDNHIERLHPDMIIMLEDIAQGQDVNVDLSRNPISCDCENIAYLEWLQAQHWKNSSLKLVSVEKYLCDNTPSKPYIIELDIANLKKTCQSEIITYVYVGIGTLVAILALFMPCVIYRKRWVLRHFFYVSQEKLSCWRYEEADESYEYDVFISYSNMDIDRTWVHFTLVPALENTYGFKACIHHRDFLGGVDIADNIKDAIQRSRKVLAIMSPDFISSNWCCSEIQMADTLDHDNGTHKVLFVMLRDIGHREVPGHIAHLLSSRTYIEVDVNDPTSLKVFWRRLVNALYTRIQKRQRRQNGYTNIVL